ncbi:MAG: glycoside hydrolase family 32 protein [Clostridia bacterium]|nr:glycoside hydrolase family 32 protein [Clostridia bacterium]
MKILISHKYLLLPVNINASQKQVCLFDGDKLAFDFKCKIDNIAPSFTAYVDVSPLMGKELEMTVDPDMPCTPKFADELDFPTLWKEPLRPQMHFTVKTGWNNDPNGLVYADGVYHMFYQYNPAAPEWGNMHWGHAVSRDLLHWEEKDIALFPDELGTMFSGSAIIDKDNIAGFGHGAMLLYYTAAGNTGRLSAGKKFTQCLAYSLDGGNTFTKYEGNPIIEHIEGGNRDPKVVYVEELEKYVMALYLANDRYEFFTSDDLVHWEHFDYLTTEVENECPDLFPLACDGRKLWVFMGAHDVYTVGTFEKDGFKPVNEPKKLTHFRMSYAAQSFSDVPDGRVLRISWHRAQIPNSNFSSQMSFPTEMRLEKHGAEYYLCAAPAKEIEELCIGGAVCDNISLDTPYVAKTHARPVHLKFSMPYKEGEKLVLDLFGTPLACDMANNELRCKQAKMPLTLNKDNVDIELICDRCSVEIFADGGKFFAAVPAIADYNLPRIVFEKNERISIPKLEWHALDSIH